MNFIAYIFFGFWFLFSCVFWIYFDTVTKLPRSRERASNEKNDDDQKKNLLKCWREWQEKKNETRPSWINMHWNVMWCGCGCVWMRCDLCVTISKVSVNYEHRGEITEKKSNKINVIFEMEQTKTKITSNWKLGVSKTIHKNVNRVRWECLLISYLNEAKVELIWYENKMLLLVHTGHRLGVCKWTGDADKERKMGRGVSVGARTRLRSGEREQEQERAQE